MMNSLQDPLPSAPVPHGDIAALPAGPAHSMASATTRLLLIGLLALALLPPLFTAIAGVLLERDRKSVV